MTYMTDKACLKSLIDVAAGRVKADFILRNVRLVNVFSAAIEETDIVISGGRIAAIGRGYEAERVWDAEGLYAAPSFIDAHIHIESSYTTPDEFGRMVLPHGTSTIIADPHEIVNVAGLEGLRFMLDSAAETLLDIRYVLPSCVPATPFEHAGAVLDAAAVRAAIGRPELIGLGEFMNFPGVVSADPEVLDKLVAAYQAGRPVDGHSPGLKGKAFNAYAAAGIQTDHECSTRAEFRDRLRNGFYVQLRLGSACRNLPDLIGEVTPENARRCLLCSDDRQVSTIRQEGHLEEHLRLCVRAGLDPAIAVSMASLNAAECYGLQDRGALAPGRRADICLLEDLRDFRVRRAYILGEEVARDGRLTEAGKRGKQSTEGRSADAASRSRASFEKVANSFHVKDFRAAKLRMKLTSDRVRAIEILPGGVVTGEKIFSVMRTSEGDFVRNPEQDLVKLAVVERHQNTGNVAVAFLTGYGIRHGAVALSVAHDSHNIIAVGVSDERIAAAVEALIAQKGGIVVLDDTAVIGRLPLPIGGLMSDRPGAEVETKLNELHTLALERLGINPELDPLMTLCFMSLAVIPKLKLTDMGLFDVEQFCFVPNEAEG